MKLRIQKETVFLENLTMNKKMLHTSLGTNELLNKNYQKNWAAIWEKKDNHVSIMPHIKLSSKGMYF